MNGIVKNKARENNGGSQQINGREGETATLLSSCVVNSNGLGGGFAPRHLKRYTVQNMKVVLLPGMDGTGILFEPFISQSPPDVEIISIPLVQSENYSYEDQARHVIGRIGDGPVVIVAESYSGMVAYHMLRLGCKNIKHIVFAASFICLPSKLAIFAKLLPISLAKSDLLPKVFVGKVLFGKFTSLDLVSYFYSALKTVENRVLSKRLSQIAELKEPEHRVDVPCTYIRPANDTLVSSSAVNAFKKVCSSLVVHEVSGTHFVLQTNPKECWRLIVRAGV